MISRRTEGFKKQLTALPHQIQRQAKAAYVLWQGNPRHPSLRFKKIHATDEIWSARITNDYRAVGIKRSDRMLWFWSARTPTMKRCCESCRGLANKAPAPPPEMLAELPFVPLFCDPLRELRHAAVRGWHDNLLNLHPLKFVYLEK